MGFSEATVEGKRKGRVVTGWAIDMDSDRSRGEWNANGLKERTLRIVGIPEHYPSSVRGSLLEVMRLAAEAKRSGSGGRQEGERMMLMFCLRQGQERALAMPATSCNRVRILDEIECAPAKSVGLIVNKNGAETRLSSRG